MTLPVVSQASVFSLFLGGVNENGDDDYVFIRQYDNYANSQNMDLLSPVLNIDPNPAKGGADITVVDGSALLADVGVSGETSFPGDENYTSDQISIYEVREGDSLGLIAEMFGVSANTIRWANDLGGSIQPGDTLVILPISGINHTIKSGDTIESIAKKYHADAGEIALYNGLGSNAALVVGETIMVPDAEVETPKPAPKSTTSTYASSTPTSSSAPTGGSGYFSHPLPNGIRTQGVHGYNGVDYGAPIGTPIYAAASGTVIISKSGAWNGGYGNYVAIKHPNGTQTLYAHNSSNAVSVGQYVNKGSVIGYVGNTGKSTGPHLHFEVRGATNPF